MFPLGRTTSHALASRTITAATVTSTRYVVPGASLPGRRTYLNARYSTYDIRFPEELKVAFNWIVDMLISAAKSSPSTSSTKHGKQRDGELEDFGSQVFLRLYRPDDDEDLEVDLDVTEMEIDELN
jgi:hypothetical protein